MSNRTWSLKILCGVAFLAALLFGLAVSRADDRPPGYNINDGDGNPLASLTIAPGGTEQALVTRNIPHYKTSSDVINGDGQTLTFDCKGMSTLMISVSGTYGGYIFWSTSNIAGSGGFASAYAISYIGTSGNNRDGNTDPSGSGTWRMDCNGVDTVYIDSSGVDSNPSTVVLLATPEVSILSGITNAVDVNVQEPMPLPVGAATDTRLIDITNYTSATATSTAASAGYLNSISSSNTAISTHTFDVKHGIGSNTAGAYGNLMMGAVTTSTPAFVNGTTNPLLMTTTGLLKVDGSGVTQPVSFGGITVLTAPTTAVTGTFFQATQPVSFGGITVLTAPTTAVTGPLTDAQLRASAITVTFGQVTVANSLTIAGTPQVTIANFPATQAVSFGMVTIGSQITIAGTPQVTIASMPNVTIGGTPQITIASGQSLAATQSGTWTVQPGNTANTTAWKVDGSAVTQPVSFGTVTVTSGTSAVTVVGGNGAITVVPQAITKGTQGSAGFTTQDLKDAGRTAVSFYATGLTPTTTATEMQITITSSKGVAATASQSSITITSGKTLRIQAINVATRGHLTATAQVTTFSLRYKTSGACVNNSTPVLFSARAATPATAQAWDRLTIPVPDGYEITGDGAINICLSAQSVYTTNAPTWDVNVVGYEY